MHLQRKKRLTLILFLVVGASLTLGLILAAIDENLDFFYDPATIASGGAPIDKRIRAGGMVVDGSVQQSIDSLAVQFRIGDLKGAEVQVVFKGIVPDLFREGQGVVAIGKLDSKLVFHATEVLAKHDENYMPPEVAKVLADEHK